MTDATLQQFRDIAYQRIAWKFATTLAFIPHEYTVLSPDSEESRFLIRAVQMYAQPGIFKKRTYHYLSVDEYKYWLMGNILNRTFIEPFRPYSEGVRGQPISPTYCLPKQSLPHLIEGSDVIIAEVPLTLAREQRIPLARELFSHVVLPILERPDPKTAIIIAQREMIPVLKPHTSHIFMTTRSGSLALVFCYRFTFYGRSHTHTLVYDTLARIFQRPSIIMATEAAQTFSNAEKPYTFLNILETQNSTQSQPCREGGDELPLI